MKNKILPDYSTAEDSNTLLSAENNYVGKKRKRFGRKIEFLNEQNKKCSLSARGVYYDGTWVTPKEIHEKANYAEKMLCMITAFFSKKEHSRYTENILKKTLSVKKSRSANLHALGKFVKRFEKNSTDALENIQKLHDRLSNPNYSYLSFEGLVQSLKRKTTQGSLVKFTIDKTPCTLSSDGLFIGETTLEESKIEKKADGRVASLFTKKENQQYAQFILDKAVNVENDVLRRENLALLHNSLYRSKILPVKVLYKSLYKNRNYTLAEAINSIRKDHFANVEFLYENLPCRLSARGIEHNKEILFDFKGKKLHAYCSSIANFFQRKENKKYTQFVLPLVMEHEEEKIIRNITQLYSSISTRRITTEKLIELAKIQNEVARKNHLKFLFDEDKSNRAIFETDSMRIARSELIVDNKPLTEIIAEKKTREYCSTIAVFFTRKYQPPAYLSTVLKKCIYDAKNNTELLKKNITRLASIISANSTQDADKRLNRIANLLTVCDEMPFLDATKINSEELIKAVIFEALFDDLSFLDKKVSSGELNQREKILAELNNLENYKSNLNNLSYRVPEVLEYAPEMIDESKDELEIPLSTIEDLARPKESNVTHTSSIEMDVVNLMDETRRKNLDEKAEEMALILRRNINPHNTYRLKIESAAPRDWPLFFPVYEKITDNFYRSRNGYTFYAEERYTNKKQEGILQPRLNAFQLQRLLNNYLDTHKHLNGEMIKLITITRMDRKEDNFRLTVDLQAIIYTQVVKELNAKSLEKEKGTLLLVLQNSHENLIHTELVFFEKDTTKNELKIKIASSGGTFLSGSYLTKVQTKLEQLEGYSKVEIFIPSNKKEHAIQFDDHSCGKINLYNALATLRNNNQTVFNVKSEKITNQKRHHKKIKDAQFIFIEYIPDETKVSQNHELLPKDWKNNKKTQEKHFIKLNFLTSKGFKEISFCTKALYFEKKYADGLDTVQLKDLTPKFNKS